MPAIKVHHTDTSDKSWDGPAAKANLKNGADGAYYRAAFAWEDSNGDGTHKKDFKFIHHEVSADGTIGAANIEGCVSGCGVLNGAMGGANIPDGDRKGVHAHLASHIKDSGQDVPALKSSTAHETKDYAIDIKAVDDTGTFTGILSVYGVVDLGGDSVDPGAFAKTLQESGRTIPCLWQHKDPIGTLDVSDTGTGLEVKGKLVLEVQQAREALALMKAGAVKGMSIGYRTIKSKIEDGVRHLKELALMEGSVVTFPMLPLAQVTSVKSDDQKSDFNTEFTQSQTLASRTMMIQSLWSALDSIVWDDTTPDKVQASADTIRQFQAAYTGLLPAFIETLNALWGKSGEPPETKEGRTISAATRTRLEEAIKVLQALLDENTLGTSQSPEAASANGPETPAVLPEPAPDHSAAETLIENMRSLIPAA